MNPLDKTIAIIGMGYVGLPLAIEFSKKFNVIGFDISSERISSLLEGVDSTNEIEPSMLNSSNLVLTDNEEMLLVRIFTSLPFQHQLIPTKSLI